MDARIDAQDADYQSWKYEAAMDARIDAQDAD